MPSAIIVDVREDLYNAGVRCDGHVFHAPLYYVTAEAPNGRRWAHNRVFKGARREVSEETGDPEFIDLRESSQHAAEVLAARVEAWLKSGGRLDPAYWREIDPAYGSQAYQDLDTMHFFKEREKAEDGLLR